MAEPEAQEVSKGILNRAVAYYKRCAILRVLLTVLFCALPVVVAFFFLPRDLCWFNVSGESMQREIPKGSLIFVKKIEAEKIQIGDTITFHHSSGDVVTHKVVDIEDNYANDGSKGFRTQGSESLEVDEEVVLSHRVIGVVVKHFPKIGKAFAFLGKLVPVLLVTVYLVFSICFKMKGHLRSIRKYKLVKENA
ncbi:MAG: signal peptidase I [Oscillospiraceae bacterium]|nr:signal peptidase I [Oscillospiraceae bacterium]